MAVEPQDARQTYQTVASRIVQLITDTGLKIGDRLPTERELGRVLGVSRHMVSQAVKVLEVSGVVQPRQGSGIYVVQTTPLMATGFIDMTVRGDPRQVQQLCEFRMTLEMQTARLAADRITPRLLRQIEDAAQATLTCAKNHETSGFTEADTVFHRGIAEATGNEYLLASVTTVIRLEFWAGDTVMGQEGGTPGNPITSANQHLAIAQAIRNGDSDAAAREMQMHIQTFFESYELEVRRRMNNGLLQ